MQYAAKRDAECLNLIAGKLHGKADSMYKDMKKISQVSEFYQIVKV